MVHRLTSEAEADIDDIWYRVATFTGSVASAENLVRKLTDSFYLLSRLPRMGRARDDWRPDLRCHPVDEYLVIYRIYDEEVIVLHVVDGRSDFQKRFR